MNTPAKADKKPSISNFLNFPNTQKFLDDNLKERRSEFVSNLIAMCDGDKNLAECDPKSLMMCAMNATALNLPLNKNLGFAYIIPYKGVPSFQIGYKGLIQLAIRTGVYKTINACAIREGELKRNKVTGELVLLGDKPNNPVVGYLAYIELMSGYSASLYMTEEEIEAHATRFSKMYQSDKQYNTAKSKWSDQEARPKMALKTVLKNLIGTYGLITTEIAKALESDDDHEAGGPRQFDDAEVIPQGEVDPPQNKTTAPTKINI